MSAALVVALVLSAATPVRGVVVYPDRAQVTRSTPVSCQGVTRVDFATIPPAADPQTVRAKVNGGTVEGITVDERPGTSAFGPERDAQEKKVRELSAAVGKLEDAERRAHARSEVGARYGDLALSQVSTEMAEPKPNTTAWTRALDTALNAKTAAGAELAKLQTDLRIARERRDEAQLRLNELAAAAPATERHAEVLVRCRGASAEVELTYLVGGASWTPAYEARADEASGVVELTTFATVVQATGEDWSKASVTLSTAVPSEDATVPEIRPLRVFTWERKLDKRVLVRRDEVIERAEAGKADAAESGGLRPVAQGLSVQLEVPGASNVPGNGTPVRLKVGTARLKATFAYRTVPKLMPLVFRVADVVNTAPYPLLAGEVDAYRKSGFIGRYGQERVAQGAPFHLTFGPEEQLRVKRLVKEELKKMEGLFNSQHRFRYGYAFELENYTGRPQTVELTEHVPVSELEDVTVEVEKDKTTAGYQLGKDDGLALWKVKLAPGEKKAVDLGFHVDVPTSYDIGAL